MGAKTAFRALLSSGDVQALVSHRIWQDFATVKEPSYPYLTFQQISSPGQYHMDGETDLAGTTFQVDIWARTVAERQTLTDAVRRAIGGFNGISSGERLKVQLTERGRDTIEERAINGSVRPVFRTTLEARAWHRLN